MKLNLMTKATMPIVLGAFFCIPIHAQLQNPEEWSSFVNNPEHNTLVKDTFLFQSFENNLLDNWTYEITGSCNKQDASVEDVGKQGGNFSLQMTGNSSLHFKDVPLEHHDNIYIMASFAIKQVDKNAKLSVKYRRDNADKTVTWAIPDKDGYTLPYRSPSRDEEKLRTNPISISQNPTEITILTENTDGCFYIDSVLAYGDIEEYSLFTGEDKSWQDVSSWSHAPAYRHRKALVHGNVSIDQPVTCREISLNGNLRTQNGASLSTNTFKIYHSPENASAVLLPENNLQTATLELHYTFPEKGKWYFIAFPFNVYPEQVGNLSLKDETPNEGGDFFYIKTYNGSRRAQSNQTDNNWDVIPESVFSNNDNPLFQAGIGYLIAIDEAATTNELVMTIDKKEEAEIWQAGEPSFTVQITEVASKTGENPEDNGWVLCGNPYPAPLKLSNVESNASTDGYIYVYNGEKYTPYAIGSNYTLPAYTSFFIKASADTELVINNPANSFTSTENRMIPTSSIGTNATEPQITRPTAITETATFSCTVQGRYLSVSEAGSPLQIDIYNMLGVPMKKFYSDNGHITEYLNIPAGIYILSIQNGKKRIQKKFIIPQ